MHNVNHPTLYQIDSKGKARYWFMQTEGGKHRTISGLLDGKEVISGWVIVEQKNVGKANETSLEEQALLEVQADYKLKLDKKYYTTLTEAEKAGSGTKFISPMLAEKWDEQKDKIPDSEILYAQPKLDGIRATISKDGILSRAGKPIPAVPHIFAALDEFFHQFPDVVLDGELYNHQLKHDFNKLSSLIKKGKPTLVDLQESEEKVQFHCYDIISSMCFSQRMKFIDENLDQIYCIKHVETAKIVKGEAEMDELYASWIEQGYEGMMIRREMSYESRRSKSLMKRKEFFDAEYRVHAIEEGLGNWAGCIKRFVLFREGSNDETFEAGVRGTKEQLAALRDVGHTPDWATVRYPNLTPDGIPRFGVVTQWGYGKRDF
jgi:DNA ligase 1